MENSLRGREYQKYLLNMIAMYRQRPDLKAYLELFLSIITIAFLLVFAIKPTLVTIGTLVTKINVEQKTSDDMDTKIKNLGTAQTLYNANEDKIILLNQSVPKGPDVGGYIRQLEGVMKKDGITPLSFSINKQVDILGSTGSGTVRVTGAVSGSYGGIFGYLKDIELMRRPSFITRLDLVTNISDTTKTINLTTTQEAAYN